jgi:HEAT repeat protein
MKNKSRTVEMTQFKENPDGSATVTFDFDEEEKEALFRAGVIDAIKAGIKNAEPYNPQKTTKFDNRTIELTWDQIDSIVVSELKESYLRTKAAVDNEIDDDRELLQSLDRVLSHFMAPSEYDEWKTK